MRRTLIGMLVVVAFVVIPRPAAASCTLEPTVQAIMPIADYVFVGTVVELDESGKYPTFVVEEQWKGSVDEEVEVRGGPPDPPGGDGRFMSASTERRYQLGTRYLVTAFQGDSFTGEADAIGDNNCSGTTEWNESLARHRPVGATFIDHDQPILPRTNAGSPPYLLIALTTILVAGGCLYLLFRRGSLTDRARLERETAGGDSERV
jgi:hypothetical protein